NQPDYDIKINQWKTQQERNLVRASIMGVTNIAANLASQKTLFRNPAPTGVIFKGKLLSTALTTSVALAARVCFPGKTKEMDRWVSQRVCASMRDDDDHAQSHEKSGHVDRLASRSNEESLAPAR